MKRLIPIIFEVDDQDFEKAWKEMEEQKCIPPGVTPEYFCNSDKPIIVAFRNKEITEEEDMETVYSVAAGMMSLIVYDKDHEFYLKTRKESENG